MRIGKTRVTCLDCGEVSDIELVVDAELSIVITSMKAARCLCGSTNIEIGGAYPDAPPLTAPLEERARWWLKRGDVGTSSRTIYGVMTQHPLPSADADIPHDPSDFARCKALLDLIPEWRGALHQVFGNYPAWEPYVEKWPELEKMLAEENLGMFAYMRTLDRSRG